MDEQVLYPVDLIRPGFVLPPDAKMIAVQKGWIKIDDDFVNLDNVARIATALNWHGAVSGAKCVIFFNDGNSVIVRGKDARKVAAWMEDIIEDTCAVQGLATEQNDNLHPINGLTVITEEAMNVVTHNAEMVRRLESHLQKTRGIWVAIWDDFTVQAHVKGHPVLLEGQVNGIFSFEEFLDWAFAQPLLTEDDGKWFRPPAEDNNDG